MLDEVIDLLCPDKAAAVLADIGRVREPKGGIQPRRGFPVGYFNAMPADDAQDPTAFAVLAFAGECLPVLGSQSAVAGAVATFRARIRGVSVTEFERRQGAPLAADLAPPSHADGSLAAQLVVERLLNERCRVSDSVGSLTRSEMLWVGYRVRRRARADLALQVAEYALARQRDVAVLNLSGACLRSLGHLDRSIASFEESIDLQRAPRHNPWAYIGLAVSLRYANEPDRARLAIMRVRRWYPKNHYVLEVIAALDRDRRRAPGAARAA